MLLSDPLIPALTSRESRSLGTKIRFGALTRAAALQAMLPAIIVLSLISLLVATEADPSGTPAEGHTEPPLRPAKKSRTPDEATRERIAA